MLRNRWIHVSLTLLALTTSLSAATGVITVNVKDRKVTPENPIVNVAAADAIEIRIMKDDLLLSEFEYDIWTTVNAGRSYARRVNDLIQQYASPVFRHNNVVLNTKRCGWGESKKDFGLSEVPCPSILVVGDDFATIYSRQTSISVTVIAVKRASGGATATAAPPMRTLTWTDKSDAAIPNVVPGTEAYIVPFTIQLVARGSNLFFSLGMTWFDNRDAEYSLQPTTTEGQSAITFAGYGEPKYQIGANAHYGLSITRVPLNHMSVMFGLSTDVPVESLSAYLGLAVTAWTFPDNNSGHIFVGVGYSRSNRLAPEFAGVTTVPATTALTALTRPQYNFGLMAGVAFSFFGGEDKFKAVFPGSKSGGEAKKGEQ